MENYDSLIDAMDTLRLQGYTEDFNLKQNCLECRSSEYQLFHDEFEIDKSFRFDADSDPNEESIIYAVSSSKFKLKGLLINSYGIYSESLTNDMLDKLKAHH